MTDASASIKFMAHELKWIHIDDSYFLVQQNVVGQRKEWCLIGSVQLRQIYEAEPALWYAWNEIVNLGAEREWLGRCESLEEAKSRVEASARGDA